MEKAVLPAVPIAASSAPSLDLDPSIATWGVLGALVIAMLAIDLVVFARDHAPPTARGAVVVDRLARRRRRVRRPVLGLAGR